MARAFASASSQYLERDQAPVVAAPMTISVWFKKSSTTSRCLVWVGDKDVEFDYWSLIVGGGVGWTARDIGAASAFGPTAITLDVWEHACGMEVSSSSRFAFLNGAKGTEQSATVTPDGADRVAIGRLGDSSPAFYMNGSIAEVAIWDVGLTDAEVVILAAGFSPLFVRPQSRIHYWPLIGRMSPEIDLVGGFDLTAFSSPTASDHPPIIYPSTIQIPPAGSILPPVHEPRQGASVYTLGGLISV